MPANLTSPRRVGLLATAATALLALVALALAVNAADGQPAPTAAPQPALTVTATVAQRTDITTGASDCIGERILEFPEREPPGHQQDDGQPGRARQVGAGQLALQQDLPPAFR